MAKPEFRVGDVVRLEAGPPWCPAVVCGVWRYRDVVYVRFFIEAWSLYWHEYRADQLVPMTAEELTVWQLASAGEGSP